MKLIVGLGNPGLEYQNTRHNIGFRYIDLFVNKNNLGKFKEKFNGLYLKVNYNNEDIIFLKPLSYMNMSGEVVKKFQDYYKIDTTNILVIHDDLDIPIGKIKLKENGSGGGHNGIKNIILNIGSENFKRLKIGISKNKDFDTKDYVLGKFTKEEEKILDKLNSLIIDLLDDYLKLPFNDLMSKYNRRDLNEQSI